MALPVALRLDETPDRPAIKVVNWALDDSPLRGGTVILRGVIDTHTLVNLKVDDYQREKRPVTRASSLWQAYKSGQAVPDIELGMRGESYRNGQDGSLILVDDVFIIDGLQRVTAALNFIDTTAGDVRIGATIHFNTTREWERERFRVLNTQSRRVSPNVLLRNLRETHTGILTLYGLCNNTREFPLYKKVCWSQNMHREHLVTAAVMARVSAWLHRHVCGPPKDHAVDAVAIKLSEIGAKISLQQLRENIHAFFALVDECFGLQSVEFTTKASWIKGGFLLQLANVINDHTDFWRGDALQVNVDLRRKIAMFAVNDPSVTHLAGAGGSAQRLLYAMMVEHINRGKRTGMLQRRSSAPPKANDPVDEAFVEETPEAPGAEVRP